MAVSLLEAFLFAAKRVETSYKEEGLLATEHALLEDNGDGLGTARRLLPGPAPPASAPATTPRRTATAPTRSRCWRRPPSAPCPPAVRRRRDELELQVLKLRDSRGRIPKMSAEAYHARIEPLLLELARIYQRHARNP